MLWSALYSSPHEHGFAHVSDALATVAMCSLWRLRTDDALTSWIGTTGKSFTPEAESYHVLGRLSCHLLEAEGERGHARSGHTTPREVAGPFLPGTQVCVSWNCPSVTADDPGTRALLCCLRSSATSRREDAAQPRPRTGKFWGKHGAVSKRPWKTKIVFIRFVFKCLIHRWGDAGLWVGGEGCEEGQGENQNLKTNLFRNKHFCNLHTVIPLNTFIISIPFLRWPSWRPFKMHRSQKTCGSKTTTCFCCFPNTFWSTFRLNIKILFVPFQRLSGNPACTGAASIPCCVCSHQIWKHRTIHSNKSSK